jgi:hypothetical protein
LVGYLLLGSDLLSGWLLTDRLVNMFLVVTLWEVGYYGKESKNAVQEKRVWSAR